MVPVQSISQSCISIQSDGEDSVNKGRDALCVSAKQWECFPLQLKGRVMKRAR